MLALTRYGPRAASTRQRILQYAPNLAAEGLALDLQPLLGSAHLDRLHAGRSRNWAGIATACLRRVGTLLAARRHAALIVQRELFPWLPAERLAALGPRPLIVDYDDAVFHLYDGSTGRAPGILRDKLAPLFRRADLAICGNDYLAEYARQHCRRVEIVPTTVNTRLLRPTSGEGDGPPVVGWIGSPSTWGYMAPVLPVLRELVRSGTARVRLIGGGTGAAALGWAESHPWAPETEAGLLASLDIGIMPLPDEPWSRGKCGYKLIQYMACGLPVVASPVGVNPQIVRDGTDGLLALGTEAWRSALTRLIADPGLRERMGAAGRSRAEEHYAAETHGPRFAALISEAIEQARTP